MRALYTFVFFVTIIAQQPYANAKVQKFKVGDDEFQMDVPKGWQVSKDFFFPVAIGSEDNADGHRSVIGITPAGVSDVNDLFEKGNKDPRGYTEGREEWLSENDGKTISYDPYEKIQWKGIEAAHVLGHRYSLPTGNFHEKSYYVLCNGKRFIHFKTLVMDKYENAHNTLIDKTIKTFQCTGPKVEDKSVALNGGSR